MKDLSKLLLAGLFTIGFSACSDDGIGSENGPNKEPDAIYMSFKLEMPDTRSQTTENNDKYVTSDAGTEAGNKGENAVQDVLVLLTDYNNDKTIATSEVSFDEKNPEGVGGGQVDGDTYVVSFRADKLIASADQRIKVYVYCNPSTSLKAALEEKNTDAAYTLTDAEEDAAWENNNFFMSNANNTDGFNDELVLPASTEFVKYNTPTNPIDLGIIDVERSVARFDYRDGSATKNYTYPIMQKSVTTGEGENETTKTTLANIVLKDAALINLSKNFYYLRRVAADDNGVAEKTSTLLGKETTTNWVVDTDWSTKRDFVPTDEMKVNGTGYYDANFYYHLTKPNTWEWTSLSSIMNATDRDDIDDGWSLENNADKTGYKIWRYVTENTIPSKIDQENGISTGVVFRGQIVATDADDASKLKAVLEAKSEKIYVFDNVLHGTKAMIEDLIYEDESKTIFKEDDALTRAYKGAFMKLKEDGVTLENKNENDWTPGEFGFTTYSPEDTDGNNEIDGYFAYYYYWNRHNDNKKPGEMGLMEFAVVRNNVYKLSVTGINKFGHPTPGNPNNNPDPDPDPVDPDDPDEDENVYFRVAVQVLPWTVRVNDIEF